MRLISRCRKSKGRVPAKPDPAKEAADEAHWGSPCCRDCCCLIRALNRIGNEKSASILASPGCAEVGGSHAARAFAGTDLALVAEIVLDERFALKSSIEKDRLGQRPRAVLALKPGRV